MEHAHETTCRITDPEAAAPEAVATPGTARVPDERVTVYPGEQTSDGTAGHRTETYGVERIPTVVGDRDGVEFARFLETVDVPTATALVRKLGDRDAPTRAGDP